MTWEEMSLECLQAAKRLSEAGYLRRSVSSAYYAAYSALAGRLAERKVTFAHGWNNPAHDQLPSLIHNNMGLERSARIRISRVFRRLRTVRENADYRPRETVGRDLALACIRDATAVLLAMGIEEKEDG